MREIIKLQLGGCGNNISNIFWQGLLQQHQIDLEGILKTLQQINHYPNVYFKQTNQYKFIPRSILVDMDSKTIENIRSTSIGRLFKEQNMIYSTSGSSNLWAKAYYGEGAQLIDYILDSVRRQVEACDKVEAFHITSSIDGGTGSGLTSLIIKNLTQYYPNNLAQTFILCNTNNISTNNLQPINQCLALNYIIRYGNASLMFDNTAMSEICKNQLKIEKFSYRDINKLITDIMLGFTASYRFRGNINSSPYKMETNLIPFPRLHFLLSSHAASQNGHIQMTTKQLVYKSLKRTNLSCTAKYSDYNTFAIYGAFRGRMSNNQIESCLLNSQINRSYNFFNWIPNNFQYSLSYPSQGYQASTTMFINTSSINDVFKRITTYFQSKFRKGSHIHWYLQQGMEQMEFIEAESNLNDLISEYGLSITEGNRWDQQRFNMNDQQQ